MVAPKIYLMAFAISRMRRIWIQIHVELCAAPALRSRFRNTFHKHGALTVVAKLNMVSRDG